MKEKKELRGESHEKKVVEQKLSLANFVLFRAWVEKGRRKRRKKTLEFLLPCYSLSFFLEHTLHFVKCHVVTRI